MKIIPLGTNGFFSSFGRLTACYAIKLGNKLIIIDAGSGIYRLAEPIGQKLLSGIKELDLFLSHYHFDHTSGFYAAFRLLKNIKVRVYGDDQLRVFEELTHMSYFPIDYKKEYANFSWERLATNKKLSGYNVKIRKQFHRGSGSLAFRFDFGKGRTVAYITDSEPCQESVDFVKGVKILLHEWEFDNNFESVKKSNLATFFNNGHVTTKGACLIAKQAKVRKLYLIHHSPFADQIKLNKQIQIGKKIFSNTQIAIDLVPIMID